MRSNYDYKRLQIVKTNEVQQRMKTKKRYIELMRKRLHELTAIQSTVNSNNEELYINTLTAIDLLLIDAIGTNILNDTKYNAMVGGAVNE